jgi:hypothetical protein
MRVSLLSEVPVNRTHGTGCLLLRLLEGSGLNVCNIHPAGSQAADASLPSSTVVRRSGARVKLLRRVEAFSQRLTGRGLVPIASRLDQFCPPPDALVRARESDVLLAAVYSVDGLAFVMAALQDAPPGIPLLLWFFDCELEGSQIPLSINRFLEGRTAAVWAFNENIRQTLAAALPWSASRTKVRFHLGLELPSALHRPTEPSGCVLIGNFWDVHLAPLLGRSWSLLRARVPRTGPLSWYAAPDAPARLQQQQVSAGPDIDYCGYAQPIDSALHDGSAQQLDPILRGARAAVLPFSTEQQRNPAYSRHSFPSRLADYCAYGLPVFAIADHSSLVSEFIRENGIGIASGSADPASVAEALGAFLSDPVALEQQSIRARAVAERQFDISKVRPSFLRDVRAVANTGGAHRQMAL